MEHEVKKVKGQLPAKLVWIAGAVVVAFLTFGAVADFGNGITANSVCVCIKMLLYLVAFVIGIVCLFRRGADQLALLAAWIYAAAAVLGFFTELSDGSHYAVLYVISMVVRVITFIVFAIAVSVFLRGRASGAYARFSRLWWIPSVVSLVIALSLSIQTEINDSQGFAASLVVMDVVVALALILPMFMLTLVVKKRADLQ